ncbi:VanZ family protein [Salinisphaera sp.]|uniref:VanZ family protein n=1 Tax=Salinisphaera sp. TaxID=1914330 RepID=UPI002D79BD99|nr:VanZ family protein [Salinisphaera sp.]HET7313264.1 VanZ family protein [Salinisphaera sp.]
MSLAANRVRSIWFVAGIALCGLFIYGCLMPNPPSGPGFAYFDKLEHGFAFIVIGAWFGAFYLRTPWRVLIALSLFAAGTEIMQWASGYRDGDPLDWLVDTVGAAFSLSVLRALGVDWVARIEHRVAAKGN